MLVCKLTKARHQFVSFLSGRGREAEVVSLEDRNALERQNESWYEGTPILEAEKCYRDLNKAQALGIHVNQTKEVIDEEVRAEYESVRKRYEPLVKQAQE